MDLIRRAIAQKPNFPEAFNNAGTVLRGNGANSIAAIAAYRQAIALRPDFHQAHSNLGNALTKMGKADDAVIACRAAVALCQPQDAEAHNNLGNALHAKGKPKMKQSMRSARQSPYGQISPKPTTIWVVP